MQLQTFSFQQTHRIEWGRVALAVILLLVARATGAASLPANPSVGGASPDPETSTRPSDPDRLLQFGMRDIRVHDPSSIVKCGDEYWFFSTGVGLRSWRSKDLKHWDRGPRVFPEIPSWVAEEIPGQRGHFWAPDIMRWNGRYRLYYSVSRFGRNTSVIALASNPTLNPEDRNYAWRDEGIVIRSRATNDFNAIDPAVVAAPDGSVWLSFGSFWSGIKLIRINPDTGRRIAPDSPVLSLACHEEIEAPHIYFREGFYYLFVNWGLCCRGIESTYDIRVGRSPKVTGPYLDREGMDMRHGGGTLFLKSDGPFIGPGHANVLRDGGTEWFSCHFYDRSDRGRSKLCLRPMGWDAEGWPVVGREGPVSQPAP